MLIFMSFLLLVNMIVILEIRAKNKKLKHALCNTLEVLEHIPTSGLDDEDKELRQKRLSSGWDTFLSS